MSLVFNVHTVPRVQDEKRGKTEVIRLTQGHATGPDS